MTPIELIHLAYEGVSGYSCPNSSIRQCDMAHNDGDDAKFLVYGQMSDLIIGKSQKSHNCNIFGGKIAPNMNGQHFFLFGV